MGADKIATRLSGIYGLEGVVNTSGNTNNLCWMRYALLSVAHRHRDLYAGVWWRPAETRIGLLTALSGLAKEFPVLQSFGGWRMRRRRCAAS
jgi:hypothetical protein